MKTFATQEKNNSKKQIEKNKQLQIGDIISYKPNYFYPTVTRNRKEFLGTVIGFITLDKSNTSKYDHSFPRVKWLTTDRKYIEDLPSTLLMLDNIKVVSKAI